MDKLEFTSSLVGSLAWPAAAVAVALIFRKQLYKLLERMTGLEAFGGKASFKSEIEKAELVADRVQATSLKDAPKRRRESAKALLKKHLVETPSFSPDPSRTLAYSHPAAAVMEAFKKVETVLNDWQDVQGMTHPPTNESLVQWLVDDGLISKETQELYGTVKSTRNIAVHAPSDRITVGEAIAFQDLCSRLAVYLQDALREFEKRQAQRLKVPSSQKIKRNRRSR